MSIPAPMLLWGVISLYCNGHAPMDVSGMCIPVPGLLMVVISTLCNVFLTVAAWQTYVLSIFNELENGSGQIDAHAFRGCSRQVSSFATAAKSRRKNRCS